MRNKEKDELEMAERRNTILREGFRLFEDKGIETTGMQEIADACHLGIATLYRYYKNKLDLVIDIGTRQWQDFSVHVREVRAQSNVSQMTAAERLDFYLSFYIDLYQNYKELLRFNSNFNSYVRQEGATADQLKPYLKVIGSMSVFFHELYEQGKVDRTIRTDMPEEKMFASTMHIMLAVAVRYAHGLIFSAENETDRTEEFILLKKMILKEFVI